MNERMINQSINHIKQFQQPQYQSISRSLEVNVNVCRQMREGLGRAGPVQNLVNINTAIKLNFVGLLFSFVSMDLYKSGLKKIYNMNRKKDLNQQRQQHDSKINLSVLLISTKTN